MGEESELSAYLLLFSHMVPILSLHSVVHRGYGKGSVDGGTCWQPDHLSSVSHTDITEAENWLL